MLILPMPLGPFQPPNPAPGGPATVFPRSHQVPQQIRFSNFGGRKAPSDFSEISIAGVLRLRAQAPVSRDKSVRRFAQDDAFLEGIEKHLVGSTNTGRSKKSQALSGARADLSCATGLLARSRRTPAVLILPMQLGGFWPPKPENRVCCDAYAMVRGSGLRARGV